MKKMLRCFVFALSLCFVFASSALAGELENKLFEAVKGAQVDVVRDQINKGANVSARDESCQTVLHFANNVADLYYQIYGKDSVNSKNAEKIIDMLEAADAMP